MAQALCSGAGSCVYSSFFVYCHGGHRDLHSFPTRRSSDLRSRREDAGRGRRRPLRAPRPSAPSQPRSASRPRSEEHTSELQSHSDLVCRLLLEKKKPTQSTCFASQKETSITSRSASKATTS